jgi:hypothetical protein
MKQRLLALALTGALAAGAASAAESGTEITLTSTDAQGVTTTTMFTPPTGKMGYGNVYTSLALAKHQLTGLGITDPTAAELQAALLGGTITIDGKDIAMTGVLELRASGMGWGRIAQQYGTKLGPVISGMKAANAGVASSQPVRAATAPKTTGVTTAAGGTIGQSRGNAYGRGITSAGGSAGPVGSQAQGNAYGRGIVTGAGGAHGNAGNAAGKGKGN